MNSKGGKRFSAPSSATPGPLGDRAAPPNYLNLKGIYRSAQADRGDAGRTGNCLFFDFRAVPNYFTFKGLRGARAADALQPAGCGMLRCRRLVGRPVHVVAFVSLDGAAHRVSLFTHHRSEPSQCRP
jgi:hypothetical protein